MKYLLLLLITIMSFGTARSQSLPPYKQYKTIPSVRLLSADSTGWELKAKLQKNKPVMMIIFSPECDHCKHETEELIKNIDKFKDIQIVMATPLPLKEMAKFAAHYKLHQYPNILVGKDYAFALPTYYDIRNLPFHAFYGSNKQLISGFEGSMSVSSILKVFGK
ncbi:TlpA family protein disulfide reductase [Niabella drilacis]|uniref:AhpC/TSA family protein n=1 Tax=Niabella drilacis (strain DSM 25811 / CCM 8410 / CCUG 62505 / LMG 26954 / E90) TaxID=1285928 RepID=A0A1G6I6S1_NIADE|nr:redoxin domain-containing protein [Niabella drilacis]SDC01456.1 AhpC/TSA family protein [Niabella drilacis]